ncbi:ferric iron uptake transcriptional regulator [Psittacicella hinzii]|uniref:Ferric uptake regulation protein n=1 Tax=Psittacicella hinzii TaxID=2028575 RepID=A0A3A1Y965_9GAMM|nr:ferric iron uptake transcriptional regulator [Psittacicella hinzii]RIY33749.1 ferric iron uptake transcriptional regulator [Psittacicella hinzii]
MESLTLEQSHNMLRKAGLKITAQRVTILNIIAESPERHIGAEEIYKVLSELKRDIGLATVYRVLNQFEEAGIVVKHNFEGTRFVFELTNKEDHDHIICTDCGKVFEFVDETIENKQRKIIEDVGLKPKPQSLYFYGSCRNKSTCESNLANNEAKDKDA